jgi:hypothetical protein
MNVGAVVMPNRTVTIPGSRVVKWTNQGRARKALWISEAYSQGLPDYISKAAQSGH